MRPHNLRIRQTWEEEQQHAKRFSTAYVSLMLIFLSVVFLAAVFAPKDRDQDQANLIYAGEAR